MTEPTSVEDFLGWSGGMLSGTKQTPPGREGHTIFWNACIFEEVKLGLLKGKVYHQIWHGDLDIDENREKIQAMTNWLGNPVWVTPEHSYRFDGFEKGREHDYDDRAIQFKPA